MRLQKRETTVTLVVQFSNGGCDGDGEKTIKVVISFRSCVVFIQTDKPLYTPRDEESEHK